MACSNIARLPQVCVEALLYRISNRRFWRKRTKRMAWIFTSQISQLNFPTLQISGLRVLLCKSRRQAFDGHDLGRHRQAAEGLGPLQAGFRSKYTAYSPSQLQQARKAALVAMENPAQVDTTIRTVLGETSNSIDKTQRQLRSACAPCSLNNYSCTCPRICAVYWCWNLYVPFPFLTCFVAPIGIWNSSTKNWAQGAWPF